MTERFSVRLRRECDGVVYSFFDGDNPLDLDNIVDLLNEQQSIIEQLERKLELKTEEVEYLKRMMVKWGMIEDE